MPTRVVETEADQVAISDDSGNSILEHVAGVDDFEVAEVTYRAAVARWPAARITLRQGARVIEDSAACAWSEGRQGDAGSMAAQARVSRTALGRGAYIMFLCRIPVNWVKFGFCITQICYPICYPTRRDKAVRDGTSNELPALLSLKFGLISTRNDGLVWRAAFQQTASSRAGHWVR